MVQRGVAFVIDGVDVGAELLDQILDRRQHAGRRVAMRVGGEAFAVADAGRGMQRRHAGPPIGTGGRPEMSCTWRVPSPVNGRPAGFIVGMFGSAPCATSSFIAATSLA